MKIKVLENSRCLINFRFLCLVQISSAYTVQFLLIETFQLLQAWGITLIFDEIG